jgi:hypothetical protein
MTEIVTRIDIINYLISQYGYKNYLEIGVRDPDQCFNWINCENKTSVDPKAEPFGTPPGVEYDYELTSDNFFRMLDSDKLKLSPKTLWDIIFIDGLHTAEQVHRDIENSLNHLSKGGTIVLHDCSPPNQEYAREDYYAVLDENGEPTPWNGTVWKCVYHLRYNRPDLVVRTINTDWGVGMIQRGKSESIPHTNIFYAYDVMHHNRVEHLGLITPEEFLLYYTKPEVK